MGLTHVAVRIRKFGSQESYTATFLVDTGAMDSMIPASALRKLGIKPLGSDAYELGSGELVEYQYGVAELSFLGEVIGTRIIFGPERCEPLLGAVALQSAGFIVDPVGERLRKMRSKPLKAAALNSVA